MLLADDEKFVRDKLCEVLEQNFEYEELADVKIFEAGNPKDALRIVKEENPHVCVLDLKYKQGGTNDRSAGFALIETIDRVSDCGIIVLSDEEEDFAAPESLRRGADFYIMKEKAMDIASGLSHSSKSLTKLNLFRFYVDRCASHAKEFSRDKCYFNPTDDSYQLGEYRFVLGARKLEGPKNDLVLTHLEYTLLKLLVSSDDKSMVSDELHEEMYGEVRRMGDSKLSRLISRFNAKLDSTLRISADGHGTYRLIGSSSDSASAA